MENMKCGEMFKVPINVQIFFLCTIEGVNNCLALFQISVTTFNILKLYINMESIIKYMT